MYFTTVLGYDEWVLTSAGPDRIYDRIAGNNLVVSRYECTIRSNSPDDLIEASITNMHIIGEAIEQFRQEKGVLLVDFWDDDTPIWIQRIDTVFETAGASSNRTRSDVLMPLVHFGYLNQIPPDPLMPGSLMGGQSGWNEFVLDRGKTYLYCDNDPELDFADYSSWGDTLQFSLEDGEWVLIGYLPMLELAANSLMFSPETALLLFSRDLQTNVVPWSLF